MKYVILLGLVAIAYAVPTGFPVGPATATKNVNINEDGTITITTPAGKKVVISRAIGVDSKYIDISVEGPGVPTKRIQIDALGGDKTVDIANTYDFEDRDKRSPKLPKTSAKAKTTSDILSEVFEEYQGAVDEKSFGKLLDKVQAYVAAGDIDSQIEDALRYLHEKKVIEQQQGISPEFKQLLDYWVQDAIRRQVGPQGYPVGQDSGLVADQSSTVQQPQDSTTLLLQQQLYPALRLQASSSSKQVTPQSQSTGPVSQSSTLTGPRVVSSPVIPQEVQQLRFVQYQEQLLQNQIEQGKLAGTSDALVAQQTQQLTQLQQLEKELQQQLIAKRNLGFFGPYSTYGYGYGYGYPQVSQYPVYGNPIQTPYYQQSVASRV